MSEVGLRQASNGKRCLKTVSKDIDRLDEDHVAWTLVGDVVGVVVSLVELRVTIAFGPAHPVFTWA